MDVDKLIAYQNMLRKTLRTEQDEDRKIDLMTIINQLTFGPKNLVQREQIILEAVHHGFSEREVGEILQELIKENIVFESTPGYIKKR